MRIEFQIADEADAERLLPLLREYAEGEGERYDEEKSRRALSELFSCPEFNRIWLIRDGEAAIGYIILTLGHSIEYGGRDAFIDELYIRASHRGRGLGARAMEVAEAAARRLRVNAIHLEVDRDKRGPLGLYRKFGFEEHERLLMTKWLGPEPAGGSPAPSRGTGGGEDPGETRG